MTHWMCTACGYYLQALTPPERCPSCSQACVFNDITCYRPECGGEQNIDPLLVGSTLQSLKGSPGTPIKPAAPPAESSRQVEILSSLNEQERQKLKSLGRTEQYEPKMVIFSEGTEARKFYLLEEGQVSVESQLSRGMRFPISVVSPGQAFGWSAIVSPYQYTATVVAITRIRVIAIGKEMMLEMMRANPALGLTIMEKVASIIASRLRNLELELAGMLLRRG
jgi:CRP-like cAMP-binding protein/rubredoxin